MVNVSPYCKSLSLTTAVKLVSLFELFTAPSFLYKDEGNYVYVALLLEVS
jgi:High-temperature-induced dauer-formation protein